MTLESEIAHSLSTVCKSSFSSLQTRTEKFSGTFVTNLHSKAKDFYEIQYFSKLHSQNICSGFHTQADKMALFKKSCPLGQKKILSLPTIPFPVKCAASLNAHALILNRNSWKGGTQPKNT